MYQHKPSTRQNRNIVTYWHSLEKTFTLGFLCRLLTELGYRLRRSITTKSLTGLRVFIYLYCSWNRLEPLFEQVRFFSDLHTLLNATKQFQVCNLLGSQNIVIKTQLMSATFTAWCCQKLIGRRRLFP